MSKVRDRVLYYGKEEPEDLVVLDLGSSIICCVICDKILNLSTVKMEQILFFRFLNEDPVR